MRVEESRSHLYHHTIHLDRTGFEKLADALNDVLKLVWVSADGREGHYCQPCYNRETAEMDWTSYSFVGFRFVAFSQETRLISWCSRSAATAAAGKAWTSASKEWTILMQLQNNTCSLCQTCAPAQSCFSAVKVERQR